MKFDVTTTSNTQVTANAVSSNVGSVAATAQPVAVGSPVQGDQPSVTSEVTTPPDSSTTREDDTALSTTTGRNTDNTETPAITQPEDPPKRHHDGIVNSHELDKKLSDVRNSEEELLTKKIANNWNLRYIDLAGIAVESDALILVPQKVASEARAAPFRINNKDISVAIENPNNVSAQAVINNLTREGYNVTTYMVSPRSMTKLINRYADIRLTTGSHGGMVDMDEDRIATISARVHKNADIQAVIGELLARPREQGVTSELLEIIMGSAIATKSSDIHIESQDETVRLRMRQDGVLEDIYNLPHDINKSLASRIKILSGMKLTITKDAQDGRFTVNFADTEIEIRVSTIPGPYGEGIVMRILDPRGLTVSFEALGIEPRLMEIFTREIAKPEGIILTTGPTGSGKTTTLYSFLKRLYDPEIKIITIEDPIEYHLPGIQQTQVNHEKGYDFLSGLRAAMRQDPEVIMVGEIRDQETAITAIQAAQTGHLVLSTLHTNNAAGVIPRLLVLGVNPGMLASTLRMAIAQRLVRRLVPETKIARTATPDEYKIITAILGTAVSHGKDLSRFGFTHNATEYTVYDPAEPTTESTGYKGRIGIYEVIVMDNTIEELLEKNPSEREVRNAAEHQGLLTMQEDAIIKILQGITSFEEVRSVIDLETGYEDIPSIHSAEEVTDPNPLPNFHMDAAQVETMWNYLKALRREQELAPDDERAEQIRDAENIIMDIMKRNHGIGGISTQSASTVIQNEVRSLEAELAELRERAREHPDPAIAAKLKQMHAIIDTV